MNLKTKVLIGSILLVAIPIIISSAILGYNAATDSRAALKKSSEERLLSVRNITKGRIEDYLYTIERQVKSFSEDRMIIDAMKAFSSAYNAYPLQSTVTVSSARSELSKYYNQEFNQTYKARNRQQSADISKWLANLSNNAVLLQYQFIQKNANPLGEKHLLNNLDDGSDYDNAHSLYHPGIRYFLEQFEFYDIFLVDAKSSNVVYSVFKELDYATSLNGGTFTNTGLARAFNNTMNQKRSDFSYIDDFNGYPPSYLDPASFIASPISDNGEIIGTLVFQMPIGRINNIMTHSSKWAESGLGESGETYLVGKDNTLRSQSRFLIEDKESYLKAIKAAGISTKTIETINAKDTAISLQPVDSSTANKALAGVTGVDIVNDYRNVSVLSAYTPINYQGLDWALLAEIDESEAFAAAVSIGENIQIYAIVGGVILVTLGAFAGWLFALSISSPIASFSKGIAQVELTSNLGYRFSSSMSNEIGQASNALDSMLEKFQNSISKVSDNADSISETVNTSSVVTKQNTVLLEQQQIQTQDVVDSMQSMTDSARSISSSLEAAVSAIKKADQTSSQGHHTMQDTIVLVDQLAKQIDTASSVIQEFEVHSNEIVTVLAVIKGIADQTNLLALNAAIEAARAGEQGRGFAVVADEVRALAGRTQSSTGEINEVMNKLKHSSDQAIAAMEQSQTLAEKVVHQATNAEEAFSEVSDSVASIAQMNEQITNDVAEQQKISSEIDHNIKCISEITIENVAGSNQTEQASEELSSLADNLRALVKAFKI